MQEGSGQRRLYENVSFQQAESYPAGGDTLAHSTPTWNEARFALIPGGPATLGYAPGSFHPSEAHQHSWEETCRAFPTLAHEYPTLEDYLVWHLTPLRQVTFEPFLLEMVATELAPPAIENGRRIYRNQIVSYPETEKRIVQEGWRLPTSDEWEYACAVGARTLWRWGMSAR
ncbi:MAG TPA: hypothetical protein VKT82_01380 [Ktedonobacterales bacterium]|nr:hypothetical protein [Ktedonobacterales bacterium]